MSAKIGKRGRRRKRRDTSRQKATEVSKAVEDLVKGLLAGNQETVTVPIDLKIPKGLFETYRKVAEQYNLPLQQALEKLANMGLEKAMKEGMQLQGPTAQNGIMDLAKANGLDLSGLTAGLSKIQELASQMTQLEETFNAAGGVEGKSTPDTD